MQSAFAMEQTEKSAEEWKESFDQLEMQMLRMKDNMEKISRDYDILGIEETKYGEWTILYKTEQNGCIQIMAHPCTKAFKGSWDCALQASAEDNAFHLDDIKGTPDSGLGSLCLKQFQEIAADRNTPVIKGRLSERDADHTDRLHYFYKKHSFYVRWNDDGKTGSIYWERN
ncbi:hypothetical protein C6I21_03040 [Alkalicoccus urumqiensis]|uniref:GNAT family N-acetyltransferase n=2 Tax=Alkalicoccus urumqiensis TaxID=1548213 RepID=A0A2P6MKW5_ALKUR|nr:hypothetical protein C6I21_03040 [Alkalicoccus urumqiensis]